MYSHELARATKNAFRAARRARRNVQRKGDLDEVPYALTWRQARQLGKAHLWNQGARPAERPDPRPTTISELSDVMPALPKTKAPAKDGFRAGTQVRARLHRPGAK